MSIYANLEKAERLMGMDDSERDSLVKNLVNKINKDSLLKKYVEAEIGGGLPILRSKNRDLRLFESHGYGDSSKAGVTASISSMDFNPNELNSGDFDSYIKELQEFKKAALKLNDYMRDFYSSVNS